MNGWLPPEAIAALGGPGAAKLPPGDAAIRITSIARNSSLINLGWTGPDGQFQVQNEPTISTNSAWQAVGSLSSNRTLSVPMTGAADFYRVTQTQPDIQVGQFRTDEQSIPSKQILHAGGPASSSSAAGRWTWCSRPTARQSISRT